MAYIDPASGGSSGIYLDKLFEKWGIADQIRAKAKLKRGGYVADLLVSGDAELGIHQISEIVPVKEVVLVGPLPAEIQNFTTYAGAVSATARDAAAAKAFLDLLAGPSGAAVLKDKGMERPALVVPNSIHPGEGGDPVCRWIPASSAHTRRHRGQFTASAASTVSERRPPPGVSHSIDWLTDRPISAAPIGVSTEMLPCETSASPG